MTHGLYSYPAKFIPHVPYYVISKYGTRENMVVLDPFAGSATTAVEALRLGHNCIVMDNNPIVEFLSFVKTMPLDFEIESIDLDRLLPRIKAWDQPFVPAWTNIDHWIEPEFKPVIEQLWGYLNANPDGLGTRCLALLKVAALYVTDYFSNGALDIPKLFRSKSRMKQIEALKIKYKAKPDLPFTMLVDKFTKYHGMVKEFNQHVQKKGISVSHLDRAAIDTLDPSTFADHERFVLGIGGIDSIRFKFPQCLRETVDIIVTSPPYVYAQEYIRSSKAHLYWLDAIDDTKATDLVKTEIGHRKDLDLSKILRKIGYLPAFRSAFDTLIEKECDRYGKNGKYTPQIANYFSDMYQIITSMKILLKPGGVFGLFVGNPTVLGIQVNCSDIFREFFEDLGYKVLEYGYDPIVSRQLLKGRKNDSPDGMSCEWLLVAQKS
jgi:DNA modification methylase